MTIEIASIDGVDPDAAQRAIVRSMEKFPDFSKATLFSYCEPRIPNREVRFVKIPRLDYRGYSLWSIRELGRWVEHDFVLTVQPDGFVLNADKWDPAFLSYDYIGAPWREPIQETDQRVGNSGFCLRSRYFCIVTASMREPYEGENDDYYFAKHAANIESGLSRNWPNRGFAPLELAKRFSLEEDCGDGRTLRDTFGFHGTWHVKEALTI